MTYAVVAWALYCLWQLNKTALRLRLYHFRHIVRGGETHTVLCTDIPGIEFGARRAE